MRRRRKPVCHVLCDGKGMALQVFRNGLIASQWLERNRSSIGRYSLKTMMSRKAVSDEFARQMQIGLTDRDVIDDLIWYCGVSTKWTPKRDNNERKETRK